eukprot:3741810-Prymnesium_polylepis.2
MAHACVASVRGRVVPAWTLERPRTPGRAAPVGTPSGRSGFFFFTRRSTDQHATHNSSGVRARIVEHHDELGAHEVPST